MTNAEYQQVRNIIDLELIVAPGVKLNDPNQISQFAQTIMRKNPMLSSAGISTCDVSTVLTQDYAPASAGTMISSDEVTPWFSNYCVSHQMPFTNSYMGYLYNTSPHMNISKVSVETNEIMDKIDCPTSGIPFDRRGLVVGSVQSGKTSNYIGLINKAADAGYKVIIVLSGLYNDLRRQTQIRIDKGFIGRDTGGLYGRYWSSIPHVGQYQRGVSVQNLTSSLIDGDVNTNLAVRNPYAPGNLTVAVCKKNVNSLDALLKILYQYDVNANGEPVIKDLPLLLIDDEADNASINVRYDDDLPDDVDQDTSRINEQIRCILTLFEQSAYIGYTATPYANVLINGTQDNNSTHDVDMGNGRVVKFKIGRDLFPSSFIYNLKTTDNYIGPEDLFGESDNLPTIRNFDVTELTDWTDPAINGPRPDSLEKSILSFIIATAIRRLRGDDQKHSSMLVHVDYKIRSMDFVKQEIEQFVDIVKTSILVNVGVPSVYEIDMQSIYQRDFLKTCNIFTANQLDRFGNADISYTWDKVLDEICNVLQKIKIEVVHSKNNNNLARLNYNEYEGHANPMDNGYYVIAIGGNCLSRGLTLEGLVTSYFYRTSVMYDTLMQMGRWFGYRPGYYDLCRLYMPTDTQSRFQSITKADTTLRKDFETLMSLPGATPKNFQLSVLCTPNLKVTGDNKLGAGSRVKSKETFAVRETKILDLADQRRLSRKNAVEQFLDKFVDPAITFVPIPNRRHKRWQNVPSSMIIDFLRTFNGVKLECPSVSLLDVFIGNENRNGNMVNWTVVLINNSNSTAGQYRLTLPSVGIDEDINLTLRTNDDNTPASMNFIREKGITQGSDKTLDGASPRPNTNGLLVIYPISVNGEKKYETLPLYGYAVFFPDGMYTDEETVIINSSQA